MIRTIDIHSHILPGFDDGCECPEETLAVVEVAKKQGILGAIVTPHYSRTGIRTDWKELQLKTIEKVNRMLGEAFLRASGNETVWHEDLPERLAAGYALTLADSRYVLVEFDTGAAFYEITRALNCLENAGYIPVIAHIERYACLRERGRLRELLSRGAKLQMNFDSLGGSLFDADARWCKNAVLSGSIHFLATDTHSPDFRPPRIQKELKWLEKRLGAEETERMTFRNPCHVLAGEPLE